MSLICGGHHAHALAVGHMHCISWCAIALQALLRSYNIGLDDDERNKQMVSFLDLDCSPS